MIDDFNMNMLVDFYEITMVNGYMETGHADEIAYFDVFFRKIPDNGGYAVMGGVEHMVNYLRDMKFSDEDIEYLRGRKVFSEKYLDYLKNFKFECDVWSVPEGTPIFPFEPVMTVRGPVIQAQFVETALLLMFNHESLITTKATRVVRAAQGRPVMEFGSRRSHGSASAVYGARAAYVGGCVGTACVLADQKMGTPALGTMAHSWVQLFPTEYEAFEKFAELYPDNCTLLVDTFDVLKSGVPNAIKVFKKLKPKNMGIRIDSGDIAYLTKQSRVLLDEAGLTDCKITASNALDEYLIRDILLEGAKIDNFGVGERLITAKSDPVFGGVYKLAAVEDGGEIIPKIKISENIDKITNPGVKKLYRIFDKESGKALVDVIALADEDLTQKTDSFEVFDQNNPWKRKKITNYEVKNLRVKLFDHGEQVYECPSIDELQKYCAEQVDKLWEETKRFENPQLYYVDLSQKLWDLKQKLIEEHSAQ